MLHSRIAYQTPGQNDDHLSPEEGLRRTVMLRRENRNGSAGVSRVG